MWLPESGFTQAVEALPLVSIDLCVYSECGLLLGLRQNAPAKDYWFTPGGRIRKGEPWQNALDRIAQEELGLQPGDITGSQLIGMWDHFYEDSAFSDKVPTHYLNLPFFLELADPINLNELPIGAGSQHAAWQWLSAEDLNKSPLAHIHVHPYVKWGLDNAKL